MKLAPEEKRRLRNYRLCSAVNLTGLEGELRDMLSEVVISKAEYAVAYDLGNALRRLITSWNDRLK